MSWSSVAVSRASVEDRATYLKKVLGLTTVGVGIAAFVSVVTAGALAFVPALLSGFFPFVIIMGLFAVNNFVARPMVFGGAKPVGFALGMGVQGMAMGFLILAAFIVSGASFGNPFILIGLAMGLTFFGVLGMTAYVFVAPRNFSMIGAALSALSIPMLIAMVVGFAFPSLLGGTFGLIVSVIFVAVSVGAVLYQLNEVIHRFTTDAHWEGAYTIAMGILTLFWNILSLLTRLSRR